MAAEILRFVPTGRLLQPHEADALLRRIDRIAADFPAMPGLDEWREDVRRRTTSTAKWRFIMLSPEANAFVLDAIHGPNGPKRPKITTRLWGHMLTRLDYDSGRVVMSRDEMKKACGASRWDEVAASLAFLAGQTVEAIKQEGKGREARWFVNPNLATHLSGAQRDAEQARVGPPGPLLHIMQGGKADA